MTSWATAIACPGTSRTENRDRWRYLRRARGRLEGWRHAPGLHATSPDDGPSDQSLTSLSKRDGAEALPRGTARPRRADDRCRRYAGGQDHPTAPSSVEFAAGRSSLRHTWRDGVLPR